MTTAHEIARVCRSLRRFARTLCGSRAGRTSWPCSKPWWRILRCSPIDMDARAALYRISAATRHLESLPPPRPRQVFLLTAVEGFKSEETTQ